MLLRFVSAFFMVFALAVGLAAQKMTTINIDGKQGSNDKIQWADNNDPMVLHIDLRIRLDHGTVVHPDFTIEVQSLQLTRIELAELIAGQIRGILIGAGVPPGDANDMCSSNGGTAVHVDNTDPQDQPDGGGTPDKPIEIPHGSGAPVTVSKYIN